MANLLSWLGGVANDIGGQFNRTANQVQRNVVNPAVNFGVRNVAQAQRNVGQVGANVQRGAFDLQQQANNARRQAEEEARRIAEQRTKQIMSIGNQAQQGFKQTSNMVTAPVRVLNKSSQGIKIDPNQTFQDLVPIARFAQSADLARQGKFMQAAQNTMRVPFASQAADVSRQMAANTADQYHAGPKIQGVNLPTRAEIEDNKMFGKSLENAGNKTVGAVQNAPGVKKVLDSKLPGGFTLRQAGTFANDNIAKPTLYQANDLGEAIVGNNDQKRLDKLGYTNDLKGGSKLLYDTVSIASLGYSGTKAMQLVKAPTIGGALKLAPNVATRQFGSGVAQNTALQLSQGTPIQQLDPMQMGLAGGTYALLGTGLPITGKVAGKGFGKVAQGVDIQRAKPMMSAIETQKFADTMRKVTPQTAPDLPTKGRMVSEGYQNVKVDFKPKPVTNDFTGGILDNANYQLRNGQISEKQYKAFIVDDYTKRTGKLPTNDEVQGFINVAKEKPYAKLEQLREQYSKPIADTAPKNPLDDLANEARKYKSAANFERKYNPTDGSWIDDTKPKGMFEADNRVVRLNIFPKDVVQGKGITKAYTLNLLKEADSKGVKRIIPSLGSYTKDGTGFMDKLASEGWVKKVKTGTPWIYHYEISPKIKDWKTTTQLTDLYNQATKNKPIYELAPKAGDTPILKKPIAIDANGNYSRKEFDSYIDSIPGKTIPMTHETSRTVAKKILNGSPMDEDIFASLGHLSKQDFYTGKDGVRILLDVPKSDIAVPNPSQFNGQKYFVGLDTMDHGLHNPFMGNGGHVSIPTNNRWIKDIVDTEGNSLMGRAGLTDKPKTSKVSIAELHRNDELGLLNTSDDIANNRLSRTTGPVEVVKTSEGHLLLDGNHRTLEAQNAGKKTIDAIVLSPEEAMKKYGDEWPILKHVLDATGDLPAGKPKPIYEMAPKPGKKPVKSELPDAIQAGKKDVYYHGTTKSDAESMIKTGFNPKLSAKGKHTESPYALFVSKDKGRLAGDHSAGNYGDGAMVKVTPNTDVKLLDGQSRTWVDSMGQSRGAKESAEWAKKLQKQGYDGIQEANGEITIFNPSKFTISEVSPKVKLPTVPNKSKAVPEPPTKLEAPAGKQVLPKGINKEDVVEVQQFGSTTKGMVGNDTDIAIFLDPKHPSFAKIGSEYNRKVGKTEYHVFPDNDEGRAVFNAMLDYKDPKYGTGKGIAIKLNKDTIFPVDNVKQDRFGVPFKEESVPVAKLIRNQEYQPRIGQSGEATTANVFKKGYQEGLSDQPMLVRKEGNKYTVLGGHSRTMGIEQRAKAGLDNPTNIKARVYENITDEQARQISRGANQGAQYESTLDMAKSISASISENKAPSVQKQNMVKGFGHDDYKYLWDVVKDNNILKEKVNAGGISAEETLAIARQGRVKGLEPEKVAGVIQGLDKAGKLTRQNAKNVINLLSGKIKAGQMRTNQIGMFGDVEKAVKAVDLLDEYQKVSAELVKKRNALAIATDTLDKKSPAYKELRLKVKEYGQKLKTVETEVVNQYNAKISKNVPEIPSKTPPPPKPPTKKVRMNEYGELQVKERGFVTTVKNSPQTTPEVAKGVKGKYEPINNIDTLDTARKEVGLGKSGRVNNKKAYEEAIDTAKRSEDYSTETQAQSLILIEHLQSKGRTQDAIDIVEKMSERATKNGQASQILAAYNRLKPEGVLMMAQREIDKAKAMNPTKYADLKIEKVQATKLRKMATELQGLTGDERIVAQKEMLDEIGRLVPTPNMTKAVTLWKAGLLTGIKGGVSGNAVGNASNILVKKIADAPASAIDTVITQFTGNRSKVFTLKGWLSGFGEGLKDGKKQIQLGTGADDLASKLDYKKVYFSKNNPAGRFAQKYTDFVFGFYSASDKPWKMAALKNSLTDLATVEAKNKGLKGAAKAKFIKETVEAPPDNLLVQATNDSLDATFQDATALGGMLSGAKRSLAKHGPVAGAVGEVVAPFTGIPSSVATKMYRYSLVSSAVDIVRAIKASNKGQFDQAAQRKVSESIGKGLTGTALLGTGYALWNAGLMTTGMPQDPKERDLWELEGKQPWSVKVGGEWLSLNYTGPVLAILGAGATAAQSIKEGNTLPQTAFIAGMGTAKAVLESSPLKGVQSTLDVISDPARNGPRYLESLAGSTIPTISADVASSIDPLQREAMSPLDAMTNRVPIWRYGLNPKLNPFGEPKANQAFGVQAIVDPFRMSEDRTTSLTTELRNLYNTNKDLGTMPSDFKKDFYGGDTKLNEKQIYDLTAKIKPEIKQAWEQIIADPRYQGLNPEQRKKVLDKAAEDIRAARKFETGVQGGFLNEGEARKKLETGAKRILRGGQTDYINKETGGEDTPKQKYETALNDYEDKKKNGEISSIDEIKIQKALKKLQAQSNFDQDTVDLYGLSLKEIDGYLKSQPNGGDIYQKLLALDDAMEAAGATRKFKNRKLVVSSGKKSTKGRKAKKGGKAKKGTAIKIPSISGSAYKAPKFVTRKIASRKLSTKALPKIKAGKVYV